MRNHRSQQQKNEDRPSPKFRSSFQFGASRQSSNCSQILAHAGGDHQIKIVKVESVPVRDNLGAYVSVELGPWGFRVEIRQNDCERARVVSPKGRDARGRPQPCSGTRMESAVVHACRRAWLEAAPQ